MSMVRLNSEINAWHF